MLQNRNIINDIQYDLCLDFHTAEILVAEMNLDMPPSRLELAIQQAGEHHACWVWRGNDMLLVVGSRDHYKVYVWNNNRTPWLAFTMLQAVKVIS